MIATLPRFALVLEGTATRLLSPLEPVGARAVVLVFWLRFRNDTAEEILDLRFIRTSLVDQTGAVLEYDETPAAVAGRTDRVAPGAGFVAAARHTIEHLWSPRVLRHSVALEARTSSGPRVHLRAGLEVVVDPFAPQDVRFTPMLTADASPPG